MSTGTNDVRIGSTGNWSLFNWRRTSLELLAACEEKILSCVEANVEATPLLLLHGMGSGVGLWVLNIDALAKTRPVYAIDLPGFGRSTRARFSPDCKEAELEFVQSIEEWRKAMNLDKFILLGHSLGGYLSAAYCMKYADRVKHLILADPWGFPVRPASPEHTVKLPMWAKVVRKVIEPFNPFAMLRIAGPWGPSLVIKLRSDILQKYEHLFPDARIGEYLYHCNAQTPSGETAFMNMTYQFGWAKYPMIERVHEIPSKVSMTLIYGSRSWVDYAVGFEVKYRRTDSYVDVQVIREAGHHVYADQPNLFNALINRTCDMVDRHPDVLKPRSPRRSTIEKHSVGNKLKSDVNIRSLYTNSSSPAVESPPISEFLGAKSGSVDLTTFDTRPPPSTTTLNSKDVTSSVDETNDDANDNKDDQTQQRTNEN